jgi:hypothetical protein
MGGATTMKKIATMMVIASMAFSAACVPSINSFCTDADAYVDRNLLGTWSDDEGREIWTFVYRDEKSYLMTYTDSNGKTGAFVARLFKMAEYTFLDITPLRTTSKQNDFYTDHLFSLHTVYQISFNGKSGNLAFLDPAWLKHAVERDPTTIGHTTVDDEIVLTDSTEKLKAFLLANADRPEAFVRSDTIRKKK